MLRTLVPHAVQIIIFYQVMQQAAVKQVLLGVQALEWDVYHAHLF
jgi:hypothetical protein